MKARRNKEASPCATSDNAVFKAKSKSEGQNAWNEKRKALKQKKKDRQERSRLAYAAKKNSQALKAKVGALVEEAATLPVVIKQKLQNDTATDAHQEDFLDAEQFQGSATALKHEADDVLVETTSAADDSGPSKSKSSPSRRRAQRLSSTRTHMSEDSLMLTDEKDIGRCRGEFRPSESAGNKTRCDLSSSSMGNIQSERILELMKVVEVEEATTVGLVDVKPVEGGTLKRIFGANIESTLDEDDYAKNVDEGWKRLELLAQGIVSWKADETETIRPHLNVCVDGLPEFLFSGVVALEKDPNQVNRYLITVADERGVQTSFLCSMQCLFCAEIFAFLEAFQSKVFVPGGLHYTQATRVFAAAARFLSASLDATKLIIVKEPWKYCEEFYGNNCNLMKNFVMAMFRVEVHDAVMSQKHFVDFKNDFLTAVKLIQSGKYEMLRDINDGLLP